MMFYVLAMHFHWFQQSYTHLRPRRQRLWNDRLAVAAFIV